MKIRSLLIKRAANLKEYPTFLVRLIIAILAGFLVMDFDYINTGKNIAENNYWGIKGIICICTLILLEYIYRTHLWWSQKFRFSANRLRKLIFAQIIFGLTLPLLFIIELLHAVGITFLLSGPAGIVLGDRSIAMVYELSFLFNMALLLFYMDILVFLKESSGKTAKDIAVF
ncbi:MULTISPECIES: hypothetical protein [Sphingobacterium]|uniref:hypothetical protein n=1 Tax=Sphingobacterium TaxID=28453 RepID=UPI0008A23115|nr:MULTISPECIES: hypothetical protein [Sphingobacterium]OFV19620.1 hypothetical protein HMPREF3127_04505 [Sphingobacterium sp. HMSC13C05]